MYKKYKNPGWEGIVDSLTRQIDGKKKAIADMKRRNKQFFFFRLDILGPMYIIATQKLPISGMHRVVVLLEAKDYADNMFLAPFEDQSGLLS